MPLYIYECKSCGKRFEVVERLQDKGAFLQSGCPDCDGDLMTVIGAPVIKTYGIYNGMKKMPEDFKYRMTQIRKEHPDGFKKSQFFS